MATPSPVPVYEQIKAAYLKYVDTAFWLRDEALLTERRGLLERDDFIFTDMLLEPILPYDSEELLEEVVSELGYSRAVGSLVGQALFRTARGQPDGVRLRGHQARALRDSLKPGDADQRNPV